MKTEFQPTDFIMRDKHPMIATFRAFWLRERALHQSYGHRKLFDEVVAHAVAILWGHWPLSAKDIRQFVFKRRAEGASSRRIQKELALLERLLDDQAEEAA